VKIPDHLQGVNAKHALGKWVSSSACPKDAFFSAIDRLREGHLAAGAPGDPNWDSLAQCMSSVLVLTDLLPGYINDNGTEPVTSKGEWEDIYRATAYIVLRRYERAIADQRWEGVNNGGGGSAPD
jgi:hypothetical protein